MSGNLIFARDSATNTLHPVSCDSNGDIDVNIASLDPALGLATEAQQVLQLDQETVTATNTSSINNKISKGAGVISAGGELQQVLLYGKKDDTTLQPLECSGDRLLVDVVELSLSGPISTSTALSSVQVCGYDTVTSQFKTLKVDSNGVLETSGGGGGGGDATAANQTLQLAQETIIAGDTTSLDSKITQGYDATVASGGNGLQQNVCYGLDTAGNLDALRVDNSGHLEITVDDFVKGQATMANSFPVVVASDQSTIDVQTLRDADSTAISTTPVLANGTFTSPSVDMNGFSQLMIIGNTTNLTDQMDWYYSFDDATFFKGSQVLYDFLTGDFAEQPSAGVGARYLRVAQTDSTASNFTVQFASSKR